MEADGKLLFKGAQPLLLVIATVYKSTKLKAGLYHHTIFCMQIKQRPSSVVRYAIS